MLAVHANPKAKSTLDLLWAGAEAIVREADRAGDVNQALIELGATVCKVRDPDCSSCPLRAWCRAYQYQHTSDHEWVRYLTHPAMAPLAELAPFPPAQTDAGLFRTQRAGR